MENEIINEEVMENVAEDIATVDSPKGFKIAAGVGVGLLACGLAYKFVLKPVIAKIKAKKAESKEVVNNVINIAPTESEDEEDIDND